jgi:hypothetical protein
VGEFVLHSNLPYLSSSALSLAGYAQNCNFSGIRGLHSIGVPPLGELNLLRRSAKCFGSHAQHIFNAEIKAFILLSSRELFSAEFHTLDI